MEENAALTEIALVEDPVITHAKFAFGSSGQPLVRKTV
jgi:hypothetical protein